MQHDCKSFAKLAQPAAWMSTMSTTLNMTELPDGLRVGLEDLAGEMAHARRTEDLGRLALLSYCEVRRWARLAGEQRLADLSWALVTDHPAGDRKAFLNQVDDVVTELERVCNRAGINVTLSSQTATSDQAF